LDLGEMHAIGTMQLKITKFSQHIIQV